MSLETKAAVEAAIAAHMADEMEGAISTGWFLVIAGAQMDRPQSTAYFYDSPLTQAFHSSVGLVDMAWKYLDREYDDDVRDDE